MFHVTLERLSTGTFMSINLKQLMPYEQLTEYIALNYPGWKLYNEAKEKREGKENRRKNS